MSGKTYPRVTELLKEQVEYTGSVNAVVRRTGLTHNTITNYLEERAEPTQKSLEKIGKAYGKTVAWLRGDKEEERPLPPGMVDMSNISPMKRRLWELIRDLPDVKVKALIGVLES